MIAYVTIGAADTEASVKFYDAALGALGHERAFSQGGWAGYRPKGAGDEATAIMVCTPSNGQPATFGNGSMIGLKAASPAQVRAFHEAALANGGTSEGEPGPRPAYGPDLYIAYVRDPVGNKLSAAYRGPLD